MSLFIAKPRASNFALALIDRYGFLLQEQFCYGIGGPALSRVICRWMVLDMSETYRYAAVEVALASMFYVEPESMGAFRGRITNLRRFGITPAAPKKGAPVEYTFQAVAVLAYCISLIEFGLDPASVKTFLDITGMQAIPSLLEDEKEDMILCFHANEMSRQFSGNFGRKSHVTSVVWPASRINYRDLNNLFHPKMPEIANPDMQFLGSRLCMMNLSHIRRMLLSSLKA